MSTYISKGRGYSAITHIYDSRLSNMVADWELRKARQVAAMAKANLAATGSNRTHRLSSSIRVDRRERAGLYLTISVRAAAPYAYFVHEGTTGPIRARTSKKGLRVPKFKYGTLKMWRKSVRGQTANPFLSNAMEQALAGTRSPFGPSGLMRGNPFG